MKRLSLQWRITLLTALLIACACVCMNLLLYRTGATGMDALNGFMMQYQPGSEDSLTIEIPQEEMSSLLAHFSQEVYDAKVVFGRKGWCITAVVTILSAAIAYFVSGRALKPLQQLAQQAQRVDQDSIATVRLDEDTVQEFGQLSRSVNRRYGTENGGKHHPVLHPEVGPAHPLWRRRISAGVTRHSGRLFADQTGTDPHGRADDIGTWLFAFPYLAEHWRNDTVPRRPYG